MIREIQPGEGGLVAEVLHELRSHRSPDDIPALVDAQRVEGYRVVGSFVDDIVVAAAASDCRPTSRWVEPSTSTIW
jgi:hypothetical protein